MAEALVLAIVGKIAYILADEAVKSLGAKLKKEVSILQVEEKLEHIASEFRVMRRFLSQAEGGEHNTSSEAWLKEVIVVAHEVEDIIDEYAHLAGEHQEHQNKSRVEKIFHKIKIVTSLRSIAAMLKKIETRLHKLSDMAQRYNFNFEGETLIGFETEMEMLVRLLIDENLDHSIVGVCGMGGLGKTTLVESVFYRRVIKEHFDCLIWVSVSQIFEVDALLRGIIKAIFVGGTVPVDTEKMVRSDLVQTVKESVEEKKYLLILDDVWSRDVLINLGGAFVGSCHGSRTVITTRIREVAAFGGGCVLELRNLSENDAWALFCGRAFKNEEKRCPEVLKKWAREIVAKCHGLPLALVVASSLVSDRPRDVIGWRRFYEQFNWELTNNEDANERSQVYEVINFSYNYLPSYLQSCFLYCSIFPEDYLIKRKRLIRLWVSEGFISVESRRQQTPEELAEAYINKLIERSMLHVVERNSFGRVKACRMHDIVRELAVSISCKQDYHMVIDGPRASRLHERAQRLSIHTYNDGVLLGVNLSSLSSLQTFVLLGPDQDFGNPHMLLEAVRFKYLRVLDLQGFPISHLPKSVTELFQLHHMGLRYTGISELPEKIGRLKNLEVLDLSDTYIQKFPHGITKLKNLRYLNFPIRLTFSEELGALEDLQTLKFSAVRQMSVGWISSLRQLRCLHIYKIKAADCGELLASIAELCFLTNLRIMLNDPLRNRFMFENMNVHVPLQHLQKLHLLGGISKTGVPSLCRLFGNSLRELNLEFSQLDEDPLRSLSYLSSLTSLKLCSAYCGHQLCFQAGWFPRLKILELNYLRKLNLLEIENEALESLEYLHLIGLDALLVFPEGIKLLKSLEEILLRDMPDEFIRRMRREDRSKVADAPTINFSDAMES